MWEAAGIASTQILGFLILRCKPPNLKLGFLVPFGPVFPIVAALLCGCQMLNLGTPARALFAVWLVLELVPAKGRNCWPSRKDTRQHSLGCGRNVPDMPRLRT